MNEQQSLFFFMGVLLTSNHDIIHWKLKTTYPWLKRRDVLEIEMIDGTKWELSAKLLNDYKRNTR